MSYSYAAAIQLSYRTVTDTLINLSTQWADLSAISATWTKQLLEAEGAAASLWYPVLAVLLLCRLVPRRLLRAAMATAPLLLLVADAQPSAPSIAFIAWCVICAQLHLNVESDKRADRRDLTDQRDLRELRDLFEKVKKIEEQIMLVNILSPEEERTLLSVVQRIAEKKR